MSLTAYKLTTTGFEWGRKNKDQSSNPQAPASISPLGRLPLPPSTPSAAPQCRHHHQAHPSIDGRLDGTPSYARLA